MRFRTTEEWPRLAPDCRRDAEVAVAPHVESHALCEPTEHLAR
jgi:hypothetical protein